MLICFLMATLVASTTFGIEQIKWVQDASTIVSIHGSAKAGEEPLVTNADSDFGPINAPKKAYFWGNNDPASFPHPFQSDGGSEGDGGKSGGFSEAKRLAFGLPGEIYAEKFQNHISPDIHIIADADGGYAKATCNLQAITSSRIKVDQPELGASYKMSSAWKVRVNTLLWPTNDHLINAKHVIEVPAEVPGLQPNKVTFEYEPLLQLWIAQGNVWINGLYTPVNDVFIADIKIECDQTLTGDVIYAPSITSTCSHWLEKTNLGTSGPIRDDFQASFEAELEVTFDKVGGGGGQQ